MAQKNFERITDAQGGPYLANTAITGTSDQVGFLTGTEITFIQNKLALQMDTLVATIL